jgi:hypothetical protein
MVFAATVIRVMIASPSDVPEARDAVEKAIHGWNDANARNRGVVLLPWCWETSSIPVQGAHPQDLINAQGVDDSDVVFALFGGRLGSPTPSAVSGTAEEVDRAQEQGKPVHMLFSTAPLPNDVDVEQLQALRQFRVLMQDRGILGEFSNPEELTVLVWRTLEHDLNSFDLSSSPAPTSRKGVEILVQPRQEREVSGFQKNGSPRYTTRRWAEVTNRGDLDAEQVRFEAVPENAAIHLVTPDAPVTIQSGSSRRVPYMLFLQSGGNEQLRVRWVEDGEEKYRDFDPE